MTAAFSKLSRLARGIHAASIPPGKSTLKLAEARASRNLVHRLFQIGAACDLLLIAEKSFSQSPTFWGWASRPVISWNSWDFYGTSINDDRTKAQTDYQATNLLSHGWSLMTVDIQRYQPTATGSNYINVAALTMDAYGRLTPATNKFPSAVGGAGFKPLADYVHSKGLKFGIHMMRDIPRQAVTQDTPILGTTNTASQIALTSSTCAWNSDIYGLDMTKPGAQAYYDSIFALVASWGVDFVKIDDLIRPFHLLEIEAIRKSISFRKLRTLLRDFWHQQNYHLQPAHFRRHRRFSNRAANRSASGRGDFHPTEWRRRSGQPVLVSRLGHGGTPAKPRPNELDAGESPTGNEFS